MRPPGSVLLLSSCFCVAFLLGFPWPLIGCRTENEKLPAPVLIRFVIPEQGTPTLRGFPLDSSPTGNANSSTRQAEQSAEILFLCSYSGPISHQVGFIILLEVGSRPQIRLVGPGAPSARPGPPCPTRPRRRRGRASGNWKRVRRPPSPDLLGILWIWSVWFFLKPPVWDGFKENAGLENDTLMMLSWYFVGVLPFWKGINLLVLKWNYPELNPGGLLNGCEFGPGPVGGHGGHWFHMQFQRCCVCPYSKSFKRDPYPNQKSTYMQLSLACCSRAGNALVIGHQKCISWFQVASK